MTAFDRHRPILIVLAFVACGSHGSFGSLARADDERTVQQQASQLVKNALEYVDQGGREWQEQQGCVSCHRISFTAWTLNRAHERGFSVDSQKRAAWNAWAIDWINMVNPDRREGAKREETLTRQSDTIAQLLLGRSHESDADLKWVDEYRRFLLQAQNDDGSWDAGGQLPGQKRPGRETKEASTMWSLLALLDYSGASGSTEADAAAIKKAQQWLGNKKQAKSIEWWVTRMLLERRLGNDKSADQLRQRVLGSQRDDGGWGWLTADPSDAFGTGLAIYGLVQDGLSPQDPKLAQGIEFLARTQREDGSWLVHGTKKKGRDEEVETAVYWGACWAVIGTLHWLEPTSG